MNKIFVSVFLALFLAALVFPFLIAAQEKALVCCQIYKTFKDVAGADIVKDEYYGELGERAACQEQTKASPVITDAKYHGKNDWGATCLINSIYRVTDYIFFIVFAVSVGLVAVGAFFYTTAAGEADKITKGKNFILYAMIGLVIAAFSKAIPSLVKFMIY